MLVDESVCNSYPIFPNGSNGRLKSILDSLVSDLFWLVVSVSDLIEVSKFKSSPKGSAGSLKSIPGITVVLSGIETAGRLQSSTRGLSFVFGGVDG